MDVQEITKKYDMKELRKAAAKHVIPNSCAWKINIVKAWPLEATTELETKSLLVSFKI